MPSYRHIFLTGEKHVGKSTLWKHVLTQANIQPAGFVTLPYEINGTIAGYCLHSVSDISNEHHIAEGYQNDVPISVRVKKNVHIGIPESFDIFGTAILETALCNNTFILMDELGKFEKDATTFQHAVLACLDSPHHHVLGVLQKADSPFLAAIQQRTDVLTLTVTKENRETLTTKLEDMLNEIS